LQRQIRSGAYLPLDKKKLPNLANLDPKLMARVAQNDPQNAHAVIYAWGTYGLGYNEKMVAEALPNAPLNSWRLIFDPATPPSWRNAASAPSTRPPESCAWCSNT